MDTETIGRPVRFFANEQYDDPNKAIFEGFDLGENMAGHNVLVTGETYVQNLLADIKAGALLDDWAEGIAYAVENVVYADIEGETVPMYPLVDCSLGYVGEDDFTCSCVEWVAGPHPATCDLWKNGAREH